MKTIVCKFKSGGKMVEKTAILTDSLNEILFYMKNEATEIIESDRLNYLGWSVYFKVTDTLAYEVIFRYDKVNNVKTLNPIIALTWDHHGLYCCKYTCWDDLCVIVK